MLRVVRIILIASALTLYQVYDKGKLAIDESQLSTMNNFTVNDDYQIMHGQFLLPYYKKYPQMKMLKIFPNCSQPSTLTDLWKTELRERAKGDGIVTCISNSKGGDIRDWMEGRLRETDFNVVIDGGGSKVGVKEKHECQIWSTFLKLWPQIHPGGLYFIEDLHLCRNASTNVVDEVNSYMDRIVHREGGLGVKFIFCQRNACVIGKEGATFVPGEETFRLTASSLKPTTDKVTNHNYQIMYGQFLVPYYRKKAKMKMLEIGLGCDMRYGPGASVAVWKALFPDADLWEAEYNGGCVEKSKSEGKLDGLNTLVGDQGDVATLDSWINVSGGADFDVVIDDGGHQQCQIWTSFLKLWPRIRPGGMYFIEDLHVSKKAYYNTAQSPICEKGTNVPHMLQKILKNIVDGSGFGLGNIVCVKYIYCQRDACVLGKNE